MEIDLAHTAKLRHFPVDPIGKAIRQLGFVLGHACPLTEEICRGYSRVENGHTVPAIETLEKMARALEVPMYQLFYEGEEPPKLPNLLKRSSSEENAWGSSGKDARYLSKLRRLLEKSGEDDRKLLLHMTQKMANR